MQEHLISQHLLVGITFIVILGISAQWLAWRLRLPAILLLLICGFAAGPLTELIDTNELFGELLLPIVSISVAIILYEDGLSLYRANRSARNDGRRKPCSKLHGINQLKGMVCQRHSKDF